MAFPLPKAALLVAAAAVPTATARGQTAFAVSDARVAIVVDTDRVAHVRATYALAQDVPLPSLRYLSARCATVERIAVSLAGVRLEPAATARGPWVDLALNAGSTHGQVGDTLVVWYVSQLSADVASIPLLLPVAPLSRPARLDLRLPSADARPVLPHLSRDGAPDTWFATLRALPSAVRVDLGWPSAGPCAETQPAGEAGDFRIRLGVFIATLVLWIPLYFWWASRQPDRA